MRYPVFRIGAELTACGNAHRRSIVERHFHEHSQNQHARVGSLAFGAALAVAPFAIADTDITSTIDSEIASLNTLFQGEADLAGVGNDVATNGANSFDTIPLADAPNASPFNAFDYELYGINPAGTAAFAPASANVFNGALANFDNAYNVELYALLNGGDLTAGNDLFVVPSDGPLQGIGVSGPAAEVARKTASPSAGTTCSGNSTSRRRKSGGRDCAVAPVAGYPGSA